MLFSGDKEMGFTGENSEKGGTAIKAGVEKEQIVFSQAVCELFDQFVFRSGGFAVNVAKRRTTDKIKQAAKFNRNGSQTFLTIMASEGLPKRFGFRQSKSCFINGQSTQTVPAILFGIAGRLQP